MRSTRRFLHVAAPLALAAAVIAREPVIVDLPALPDEHGLAGAFAGIHAGHLLAAGGANFPRGMPWEGGRKVWHDRVLALSLEASGASWREVGRLPSANGYGVSLTVAEGVLVIGGGDAARHFTDAWLMTYTNGRLAFRRLPPLPVPLAQMAGDVVGRRVHVIGGIERPDATAASRRHLSLDLDALEIGWTAMPDLPAAGRILATAAGAGGAFYVFGGCSLAADEAGRPVRTYLRDAWTFAGSGWRRLADLPRPSAAAGSPAPVGGHRVFVVSGDDGTASGRVPWGRHPGFTREILQYDVQQDRWHRSGRLRMPAPVTVPTAPWRGGFVFFNGEVRPGVRTNRVFILRPGHSR